MNIDHLIASCAKHDLNNYNMNWRFQVGALQDVRSELSKLRGVLFHKVVEDLHHHLYNKGEYRCVELLDQQVLSLKEGSSARGFIQYFVIATLVFSIFF